MNLFYQKEGNLTYNELPELVHRLAPFLNDCGLISKWTVNRKRLPFVIDRDAKELEIVMYSGIFDYRAEFIYTINLYEYIPNGHLANIMASIADNIINEKIAQVLHLKRKVEEL